MAGFNLADYVDVAERIQMFAAKYPEGSLRSELTRMSDGWLCRAEAWRTPDDRAPGVGHAFEPTPGKTPYTRDSEAMNAETSAWGRAIIALGFQTKKIASADEVSNRQPEPAKVQDEPKAEPSSFVGGPPVYDPPRPTKAQKDLLLKLGRDAITGDRTDATFLAQLALDIGGVEGTWPEAIDMLSREEVSTMIERVKSLPPVTA